MGLPEVIKTRGEIHEMSLHKEVLDKRYETVNLYQPLNGHALTITAETRYGI